MREMRDANVFSEVLRYQGELRAYSAMLKYLTEPIPVSD
jgi:hypothetical protein